MIYSIYKVSTGQIEKVVTCSADVINLQFDSSTHAVIEGELEDSCHYIENGIPVDIVDCPSKNHIFDYATKQWIDPRTPDTEWPLVRADRDRRLQATDWTQLPDVPLATKEAWATYRQALRDVTLQPDPFNIVWPVLPY